MGFPQTLAGLTGLIIFLAFFLGIVLPNLYTNDAKQVKDLQENFNNNLNNTITSNQTSAKVGFWSIITNATGTQGIYDFITGFFQMIISFIQLVIAYLGLFIKSILSLPIVFQVLIFLFGNALFIAIIKLVFLSGD